MIYYHFCCNWLGNVIVVSEHTHELYTMNVVTCQTGTAHKKCHECFLS